MLKRLRWFLLATCLILAVSGCFPGRAAPERTVAAGVTHSLVLTEDGEVYAFGSNEGGQLGLGDDVDRNTPTLIQGLENVVAVAAGGLHSLALTAKGEVYAFGWNEYGQLGLGDNVDRYTPTRVEGLRNVVAVAAGGSHSLVVTKKGEIFAFGGGSRGQLGLGDNADRNTPTRIESLAGVKAVAAGFAHNLVLLENGELYAFGWGEQGQLGIWGAALSDLQDADAARSAREAWMAEVDGKRAYRNAPVRIEGLAGVRAIAAGGVHSLVLLENGDVYSFGRNEQGQLGQTQGVYGPNESCPVPLKIGGMAPEGGGNFVALPPVRAVAAGPFHTLLLLEDGTVLSCGQNKGQLGLVELYYDVEPFLQRAYIEGRSKAVAAGWAHSLVLKEGGDIYAFGVNELGQLGLGDNDDRFIPTLIESLSGDAGD